MDRRIRVTVPVLLKGEPRGVKLEGGVLDFLHREIEMECLPAEIPNSIEVDVSGLGLNDAVYVRDVAKDVTWQSVTELDTMLAHVVTLRVVEEPAPGAETVAAPAAAAAPAPSPRSSRRARPRRKARRSPRRRSSDEARRRPRQSGCRIPRYPAQRRVPGDRRAGAPVGRGAVARSVREPCGQRIAKRRAGVALQAAHLHEPERPGGGRHWPGSTRCRSRIC